MTICQSMFLFDMDEEYWQNDQSEELPDGTTVWRIGVIGCNVRHWDMDKHERRYFTNTEHFSSREEQDFALHLFAEALTHYDGRPWVNCKEEAKARVEYTKELIEKFERGDFIK